MDKKVILIFGVGELQKSIIHRAKEMGLFVVGIDPCEDAYCKNEVDAFEVVGGQDYEGTLAVVKRYDVDGIVTAATDKPLVMMARIAQEFSFPFYSIETARWSTDKFQMKERFLFGGVPCAQGCLISSIEEANDLVYPVIAKPRDNSGSRGVKLCRDREELQKAIGEALQYSKENTILVEEFIEGQEYSIEALHYKGKTHILQFTEKRVTPYPYNVELGHIQPANLSRKLRNEITQIIETIGSTLHFENCSSHSELKINERGIFVIETSPRLGGDYITSSLVPLSTGISIEDQLLHISLNEPIDLLTGRKDAASAVRFFSFPEKLIKNISPELDNFENWYNVNDVLVKFYIGDKIKQITNSLNRYGHFIVSGDSYNQVINLAEKYHRKIQALITFE